MDAHALGRSRRDAAGASEERRNMGVFKHAKDAMQAAQAGTNMAGAVPVASSPDDDPDPINGVSLEQYAQICKTITARGLDSVGVDAFVQTQGITPGDWKAATDGWNARFTGNLALGMRFGNLLTSP
jgi:hypothetical protein